MNSISFALIALWGHLTSHCSGALSESELVLTSMIFVFLLYTELQRKTTHASHHLRTGLREGRDQLTISMTWLQGCMASTAAFTPTRALISNPTVV